MVVDFLYGISEELGEVQQSGGGEDNEGHDSRDADLGPGGLVLFTIVAVARQVHYDCHDDIPRGCVRAHGRHTWHTVYW